MGRARLALLCAGSIALPPALLAGGAPDPGWRPVAPGIEVGSLTLEGGRFTFRATLVRFEPGALTLSLVDSARAAGLRGAWSIDAAPAEAVLAMNAGQFRGGQPWGWLVQDRREVRRPGYGPLSTAVAVTTAGEVLLVPFAELAAVRGRPDVAWAFQSYPTLLVDGRVPEPLAAPGRGVDLDHRDTRLALGRDARGRIVAVLTRFPGVGAVPLGPTVPEMASLMASLGCRDAVLLDGGLSGQLLVRGADGPVVREWSGLRRVPLGLVGRPRPIG